MLNKKQNILREALTVVLLLASVALAEYWFFQLWRLDWKVPMLYGGDGIYWAVSYTHLTLPTILLV